MAVWDLQLSDSGEATPSVITLSHFRKKDFPRILLKDLFVGDTIPTFQIRKSKLKQLCDYYLKYWFSFISILVPEII